jgi:hypothetical protein
MRLLAALHRWWGLAFCLLFAMWFASGIVMHFVPFPARNETLRSPRAADAAVGVVRSEQDALSIAAVHAHQRGLDASHTSVERIDYDQWTIAGDFDPDRPLYRAAINDDAGTEFYVSSVSGDVVLLTTFKMRLANYFGSIAHWIYPTVLRHDRQRWSTLMWWLSLVGTIGACIGVAIGLVRFRRREAYKGLQRWHHLFGLIIAPFVLCWIFSGFVSMNESFAFAAGLFRLLHTFDFPPLSSYPWLRSSLIVGLCLCGLAFSLTGVTLAWRRLRMSFPRQK